MIEALAQLETYCKYMQMLQQLIAGSPVLEPMDPMYKKHFENVCERLSKEKQFSIKISVHFHCCLMGVVAATWLPIEERRVVARLGAESLASEIKRLTKIPAISPKEKERLELYKALLMSLANWANIEMPFLDTQSLKIFFSAFKTATPKDLTRQILIS